MTTSNQITLDLIKDFLSLDAKVEPLNIAPTATGGTGINNIDEFPPPKPCISVAKKKDTAYVKKYLNKAKVEMEKFQASNATLGSSFSVNDLEDVEDASTAFGDLTVGEISELDSEKTKQLYSTYYSVPNRTYDADLNVSNYREEILQQLNINPVLIIEGPTGCGKTTQVPQFILDYHASKGKFCNIIVTQPRKIAAISIARRVCQERNWQLGTIVGYQVAMDPKVSADTRLCYVTTGVLLEKLVSAKSMDKYTHVIIDEVHERDQDIDFALLLVKKFLMTNSQRVKVILMSATFDTSIFAQYFSLSLKGDLAPVVEISGKTKEVTEHYLYELKTIIKEMPEFDLYSPEIHPGLYDTVLNLLLAFDRIEKAEQNVEETEENRVEFAPCRGAVLIFLPGYEDIATLSNKLSVATFNKKFWIIPLHSMITLAEQSKVFMQPPADHRKVIISTNIAESSITVPDIKYVIDFCLTKSLVTDPNTNYSCLQLEWASKANCTQRKGRAGRVDIGKVYRMVPKSFYEQFAEYSIPEIKRCPLTRTILHLKRLDVCEPQEMLAFALDPPYLLDIENSILQLKEALALYGKGSNLDGDLTFIGDVMASLPLDIKLSKLILFGYAFSCLEECIIIAACLSLQSFFARPFNKVLESYRSRFAWADYTFSDCFAYLNAYEIWKKHSVQSFFLRPGGQKEKEWGDVNFIQIRRIKEVDKLVKEIKSRLEKHNIYIDPHHRDNSSPTAIMVLKVVIAGAFFPHYFLQERPDEKIVMREINDADPLSTVVLTGLPKHGILYSMEIRDIFSGISNNIDTMFEERKAYIQFGKHEPSSKAEEQKLPATYVHPAVYLAVKMRQLQRSFEISCFNEEEAERRIEQLKQSKMSRSSQKLVHNRFSVHLQPTSVLQKARLPPPECTLMSIFISHVNNCGHFWARLVSRESSQNLHYIEMNILNIQKENGLKPLDRRPQVNLLCLAPYKETDVHYYRAEVREILKNGTVRVHFVDYGNEEIVRETDLRGIPAEFSYVINTPAIAFECYLSEIKPSASHHFAEVWSDKANRWFRTIVNGQVLEAKVYSVIQDSVRMELLYQSQHGTINSINKDLIAKGYGIPAEESLASKQNHEYRMKSLEYNNFGGSQEQESGFSSMEFSLEEAKDFSNLSRSRNKVRLHGPSNPLEVSYVGLTHIDRSKCVKVERDSINSVSFNAEPQDICPTMLVASSLTIGQISDNVSARNTTLMPKIWGLPSLLCLIFAPCAEIRTDKERKSYTGALCGLGYDSSTSEPLYVDHDMEIEFDTEITIGDISDVNAIRMGVNMLLQSKDESKANLIHYRKMLREKVISLLQKKRTPREPYLYSKPGKWNQVPSIMLLQPDVESTADNPHVLPLHRPPGLDDPQPEPVF